LVADDPHADSACDDCHTDALLSRYEKLGSQWKVEVPPGHDLVRQAIQLTESEMLQLHEGCRDCHEEEFAEWQRSGHAVNYAQIFLDRRHNKRLQLNNDCLRCHGMFYRGTIHDLVTPIDTQGPWRLKPSEMKEWPTIPCLACHQIHPARHIQLAPQSDGPLATEDEDGPARYGFFDQRERLFFPVAQLPKPRILDAATQLEISADPRIRVCYQCHAPLVSRQAGSGDDRTPRGVHAKLSCFDCHKGHSLNARSSCADCHPAESHCGLEVQRMDTSYSAKSSPNDIHTVRCQDCHPQGVPETQ
jgi:hypothetical protein